MKPALGVASERPPERHGYLPRQSVRIRAIQPSDPVGTPGALSVSPSDGLTGSGAQGGPFSPSSVVYTLTNTGGQSVNWTAAKTQTWVTLSKSAATLAPGASDTVRVSITSRAQSLTAGSYSDAVTFTNDTNGSGNTSRSVAPDRHAATCAGGVAEHGINRLRSLGGPLSPSNITNTPTSTVAGADSLSYDVHNNTSLSPDTVVTIVVRPSSVSCHRPRCGETAPDPSLHHR